MTSQHIVDPERGAGYVYQWHCALLLATHFLIGKPSKLVGCLQRIVADSLRSVQHIRLEGGPSGGRRTGGADPDRIGPLEDIALVNGARRIEIQVKLRSSPRTWSIGSPDLIDTFRRFHESYLEGRPGHIRYVFMSNRPCSGTINDALDGGRAAAGKLHARVLSGDRDIELDTFIAFLRTVDVCTAPDPTDLVAWLDESLEQRGVSDPATARSTLFDAIALKSTTLGGGTFALRDILDAVPEIRSQGLLAHFGGSSLLTIRELIELADTSRRTQGKPSTTASIAKLDALMAPSSPEISQTEAMMLVIGMAIADTIKPGHDFASMELTAQSIFSALQRVTAEYELGPLDPFFPNVDSVFTDSVLSRVAVIAEARDGLQRPKPEYDDWPVRGEIVRTRHLALLCHLGSLLSVDSAIPGTSGRPSLRDRRNQYITSIAIDDTIVTVHFEFPQTDDPRYNELLAEPFISQLNRVLTENHEALRSCGVRATLVRKQVRETQTPQPVPAGDWFHIRRALTELLEPFVLPDRPSDHVPDYTELAESLQFAEQRATEGEHAEAGKEYESLARTLAEANLPAQSRDMWLRAARAWDKADLLKSAYCRLEAASVWFDHGGDPLIVRSDVDDGLTNLASSEVDDAQLSAQLHLSKALIEFGLAHDAAALDALDRSRDSIVLVEDRCTRDRLLSEHATTSSTMRIIWRETTDEHAEVATVLSRVETCRDARLALILHGLKLAALDADVDRARHYMEQARRTLMSDQGGQSGDPAFESLLTGANSWQLRLLEQKAVCLARAGDLEQAWQTFDDAADRLRDLRADGYHVAAFLSNRSFALLHNGASPIAIPNLEEPRRIDLFRTTNLQNPGYSHEQAAIRHLREGKWSSALGRLRLSHMHYWRDGWWLGLQNSQRLYAELALTLATKGMDEKVYLRESLLSAVSASSNDKATEIASYIAQHADRVTVDGVVDLLVATSMSVPEATTAVMAIGGLADVVRDDHVPGVCAWLSEFAVSEHETHTGEQLRRRAVESYSKFLSRLAPDAVNEAASVALTQLTRSQFWVVTDSWLSFLTSLLEDAGSSVPPTTRTTAAEVGLDLTSTHPMPRGARALAVVATRSGVTTSTERRVVEYLLSTDEVDGVLGLSYLNEPVEPKRLKQFLNSVIRGLNPIPTITEEGQTAVTMSNVRPSALLDILPLVSEDQVDEIVDALIRALLNKHNSLGTRAAVALTLSHIPAQRLRPRLDEIFAVFTQMAAGAVPRSGFVDTAVASQTDPLATFRINTGTETDLRYAAAQCLGRIHGVLEGGQLRAAETELVSASFATDAKVRQGAAIGLGLVDLARSLRSAELIIALGTLVRDPEDAVRAAAGRSIGRLLRDATGDSDLWTVSAGLLSMAETDEPTVVRLAAAHALSSLKTTGVPGSFAGKLVDALEHLREDASFAVREAVSAS